MSTVVADPDSAIASPGLEDSPRPAVAHPLALVATGGSLYVALLTGMASLNGVVEGFGWLFSLWLPLLLVHAVGALVRGSRLPSALAPLASLVVILASIGLHPRLADPSLGTDRLSRFNQILQDASLEFATQVPEVAFTPAVDFSFLVLALFLAFMVEILASFRRLAGLVILPLAFAPVLASLFKLSGAGSWYIAVLLLALICYFSFLSYAWPGTHTPKLPSARRMRMSGVLALLTVLVLGVSSAWMPGFHQGMLPEGSRPSGQLFASNLDPLLNLGRDLRSNNTATALTYFTSSPQAPYLRTYVVSNLEADRWEPDPDPALQDFSGTAVLRDAYRSVAASSQYTQIDWADVPRDQQLPLPANSYLVEGVVGHWKWQPRTAVARFTTESREATEQIRIWHSEPEMDADLARNLAHFQQLSPPVDQSLSQLPQDAEGALKELLEENLKLAYADQGPVKTDFDRAVAIQDYLRSARFKYSEQTPLREGYDGANLKVITAFLDRKAGYCVHFASTMAMLARAEGIPSRVVIGYAPGEPTETTRTITQTAATGRLSDTDTKQLELTGYRVSGQQAHAWPELYLPGLGWTPFEPTPGRGVTPEYAPAVESSTDSDSDTEQLVEWPEELAPSAPAPSVPAPRGPEAATDNSSQNLVWKLNWVILPLAILGGFAALWRRRHHRRRQHLERLDRGGEQAAQALWVELQLMGTDAGLPLQAGQSERDYCAMLAAEMPRQQSNIEALLSTIECSFYALQHPEPAHAPALRLVLRELHDAIDARATLSRRVLCRLWPAVPQQVASGPGAQRVGEIAADFKVPPGNS